MTRFPLGRTLEHDPLSKRYVHPYRATPPRSVTHALNAPPLNQGQLGSCEGNSGAELLNTARALRNRRAFNKHIGISSTAFLDEVDAVQLYSKATTLDGGSDGIAGQYPPTDTGTSGLGIAKALQFYGAVAQYNWTFTWTAFLTALTQQPVMLGTNWYESMFNTTDHGYVVAPRPRDEPVGGHAYLAFAVNFATESVGCTNHWGTDWGTTIGGYKGSFWIPFTTLQRLLIREQGDSLVPVLF